MSWPFLSWRPSMMVSSKRCFPALYIIILYYWASKVRLLGVVSKEKHRFGIFFYFFSRICLVMSEKGLTFALANKEQRIQNTTFLDKANWLGYGVMVTLQILVLPFLVRIRVSQQKKRLCQNSNWHSLFFSLHIVKHCYLELRFQKTSIKMNKSVKCFCVSRICFIFLIKEHWYWALDGISR